MKTIIMNQDIHQPAFIKADASYKTENTCGGCYEIYGKY